MLQSKLISDTKKEWPSDAQVISHAMLIKGGFIKQMASGMYTFLPLGRKVISKIENIIREEMNKIGAQEISMPLVATKKLWDMSGRYDSVGSELLRFKDRNNTEMVLSMTHEEATVFSLLNEATSYTKYPFSVYQIGKKFRDEARPRAGLIRVREFTMKDAYSFHTSNESLDEEYDKYFKAYERIFKRVGIEEVIAVKSDTGVMGGNLAHEFMLLVPSGEDKIITCKNCDYSANMEVATTKEYNVVNTKEKELEKVLTENVTTIEELEKNLNVNSDNICKAVVYSRLDTNSDIIVFIRADRDVNETKLRNILKIDDEDLVPKMANKKQDNDNLVYGYIGPVNLVTNENTKVLYDKSLENEKCLIAGANEENYHFKNVNLSRDVSDNIEFMDVAKVKENDICPNCNHNTLKISNGIEVGNIFKLGTKYTEMLNMTYLDENSKKHHPIMGCYGIGVDRLFASILEAKATEKKTNLPPSIAPYDIHICPLDYTKNEEVKAVADKLYNDLSKKYDVLMDDRNKNAGVKFADSDLISAPIRIVVSKRSVENKELEIKCYNEEESVNIKYEEILDFIDKKRKEWIF